MDVGIVGVQISSHNEVFGKTVRDAIYECTRGLLQKLGIDKNDVDTVVTASSDYYQGISCSNSYYFEAAASYLKDATKVEGNSIHAFMYALMRVLSGHFGTALVLSVTKASEIPQISELTYISSDPFYQRPVGICDVTAAALQATKYIKEKRAKEEDFAEVCVKNLKNAFYNEKAYRKMLIKVEDVLNSPYVATPIREYECPAHCDGVVALLIARRERIKEICNGYIEPAWVAGAGWGSDPYFLGDRDLIKSGGLRKASEMAFKMAKIENPVKEVDVAEISDTFAHQELLWFENIFSESGVDAIRSGLTTIDGDLPANPSGGSLATNPPMAAGLLRVAEAALQVMNAAGAHQVADAEVALAHQTYGNAGQHHAVVVLRR
ncbi:hypothetical protein DRP04_00460 [Archaeoglobales archaeon]|nr:MAG: hypothetical protein DRP04_00460 [Archaeoglobales archaeon]